MEGQVNAYQGLNLDMGYDTIPNNLYINAVDIRITTDKGESLGSFTNLKGMEQSFTVPQTGAQGVAEIIGFATIRNRIIAFVADDSGNNGWLYLIEYDPGTRNILPGFPQLLKYDANFNFKKSWPIKALGRYENEKTQKVYWLDYNNYFRSVNIEDPNLSTLSLGLIDIYPDINYTQPLLKAVNGGGAMLAGSYQVTYRLITSDGKQTLVAPPSNVFHIVQDSETSIQSGMYNGDILDTVNTGKSITVTIDTSNYGVFESIELIVVRHTTDVGNPIITSAEIKSIAGNNTVDFVYTGNELTEYILENLEYIRKNFAFKTAKTLAQKDSSLVISNIKQSSLSLQDLLDDGETFDAKTYRYRNIGGLIEGNASPFNTEYNSDAQWNPVWHDDDQWKYKSDGLTLGGQGVNISYNFHLEPFSLDGSTVPGTANVANIPDATHNLYDGYSYQYNSTFPNAASPFISGLLRGYKRGETYRFGIIFYTKKGEATFVEHIGDIKFPDISEKDKNNNLSGTKYFPLSKQTGSVVTGYSLGIQFSINFSSCPSIFNEIESFQIVRVKREEKDKRRVTQGTIKGFYFSTIGDKLHDFDLKVNGDSLVMHLFPYTPAGQANGTFQSLVTYVTKSNLGFYSPDISYDKNNLRTIANNVSNVPFLLITGAHNSYAPADYVGPIDLTSENLPVNCYDKRNTSKTTIPVSITHDNCKKMEQSQVMVMNHESDYTTRVTPVYFGSYYMRNYYAIKGTTPGANLNDPKGGEFWRAGTSALTKINYPLNDPLTGQVIDYSFVGTPEEYFPTATKVLTLDPATGNTDLPKLDTSTPIVDLLLPKVEVYGGYSDDALANNVFIAASPVIDLSNTSPIVFGGDTFVSMFLLQSGMLDFNGDVYDSGFSPNGYTAAISQTESYPVETTINLDLAYGSNTKTGVTYLLGGENREILRQETNNYSTVYGKTLLMYDYNNRYSVENKDVTFFVKPKNFYAGLTNDIRGYLSNVKINAEIVDSWTKFAVNNFYDVDDYGPINEILNFKDSVFFFQDRGVGMYNINKAAILTTTDGIPTQIGSGQGFQKHLYLSKESGSIHQWGIKATENAIYYFDAIQRKLNILAASDSGQSQNAQLSELKGMHSFVNSLPPKIFLRKEDNGDVPILGAGVVIGRDKINDEVLFTFISRVRYRVLSGLSFYAVGTIVLNPNNNQYYEVTTEFTTNKNPGEAEVALIQNSVVYEKDIEDTSITLVYDELAQSFSSFYSATPGIYLENGDILQSPNPNSPSNVFTHNIGDWGSIYGSVQEMSISLVINPNADINKVLRFLEYNSIVRDDAKVIDRTATITAIKIDTQYQTTGKVPYSTSRIKRRFDKWRVKIPRDLATQGRLRSTYFIVTLYFDNSNNKELIMNRLLSYYDAQMF